MLAFDAIVYAILAILSYAITDPSVGWQVGHIFVVVVVVVVCVSVCKSEPLCTARAWRGWMRGPWERERAERERERCKSVAKEAQWQPWSIRCFPQELVGRSEWADFEIDNGAGFQGHELYCEHREREREWWHRLFSKALAKVCHGLRRP